MTIRANRLTDRATSADGLRSTGPPAPTHAARDIRVFVEALARLGFDPNAVVGAAAINRADLDDPDGRIPCASTEAMFQHAMRERPIRNLGARIAAVTPIGAFPMIDYLVVTSDSVGAGLKQLARYHRLVGVPIQLDVHDDEDPVRVVFEGLPSAFGFEFELTLCVLHLREETEDRFRVQSVCFAHRPDDTLEIERLVGGLVQAEASWNGLVVAREAWELPFRRRDPILRRVLEDQANAMLARLPVERGAALEVRRELTSRVAGGDVRIDGVARALARSVRSLQRQLAAEGASYQQLVDATRRDAAERYLANTSLPIAEVAYLLGYAEPAVFHRAFKRWRKETPQRFRQRLGAARFPDG
jgi:AraC-like DNA-binding protein